MTIEQEARDLRSTIAEMCDRMDEASPGPERANAKAILGSFVRENATAILVALERDDETQAAFDAYRREVSEALRDALPWTAHGKSISAQQRHQLSQFIIPKPVDPLVEVFNELGWGTQSKNGFRPERLRAALAKRGLVVREEG